MFTITTITRQLFYIYSNPNHKTTNNYKVKQYYNNNENNVENNMISNSYLNYKQLTINNIDYYRYKLSTFIKNNNNTINNTINNKNNNQIVYITPSNPSPSCNIL
jgi:hypothetical protein